MSELKLITNYIYFYHLDKFCIIPVWPESTNDNISANFKEQTALSRTAPTYSYSNSGPRSIQFTLKLHRDLMNDVNTDVSNLKDNVIDFRGDDYIDILTRYLTAAALPRYQIYSYGSKSLIPPMVAIRFGNDIFIKGVVTETISVKKTPPILPDNKYAEIEIHFTVREYEPYDADSVVQEGSFRGITSAFKDGIFKSTTSSKSINITDSTTSTTSYKPRTCIDISGSQSGVGEKETLPARRYIMNTFGEEQKYGLDR